MRGGVIAMFVAFVACGARTELRGTKTRDAATPASVVVRHLALGMQHTCALVPAGVYCWGKGEGGELGDGTAQDSATPRAAAGLSAPSAPLSVASGDGFDIGGTRGSHTCAIRTDHGVVCWGENVEGDDMGQDAHPTLVPTEVAVSHAVALGVDTFDTCAVIDDGSVQCWGTNVFGALGNGTTDPDYPYDGKPPTLVKNLDGAVDVTAGFAPCALRNDGTVMCWGNGYYGELGNGKQGNDAMSSVPAQATIQGATGISSYHMTCVVLGDGHVACWGTQDSKTVLATPTVVEGVSRATQVAVGATHVCALVDGGGVMCWGSNDRGQLGTGTIDFDTGAQPPTLVPQLPPVTEIAAGMGHTCAMDAQHNVWCWGQNDMNQVSADPNDVPVPTKVALP